MKYGIISENYMSGRLVHAGSHMNLLEEKILDAFTSLIKKKLSVHRIELFGSRARGDADPDSDMDVLVVVNDLSPELEDYISECAWEAGFEYGIVLVPVVFTRDEWENGPERYSLLAEAIRAEAPGDKFIQ